LTKDYKIYKIQKHISFFQNPVSYEKSSEKNAINAGFFIKFKVAFSKAEVLKKPHIKIYLKGGYINAKEGSSLKLKLHVPVSRCR